DRVDLGQVHELLDVDGAARLHGHRVELLVGQHDVTVLLVLVPLDDVVVRDLLAVDLAHALVSDAAVVGVVELVEPEGLLLGGRVDGHRDRHQAEGDGPLPHRSGWHVAPPESDRAPRTASWRLYPSWATRHD